MNAVLLLLSLPFADAARLASDDFDARQRAEGRLSRLHLAAAPAVLWASRSADLEVRLRAGRLRAAWRETGLDALAVWLFYGPDQCEGDYRRFLQGRNSDFACDLSVATHHALAGRARRWGLLGPDEPIDVTDPALRVGWVNVIRHRVARLPDPR